MHRYTNFLTQIEYDEAYAIVKSPEGWDATGTSLGTTGKNFLYKSLNDYPLFSTILFKKIEGLSNKRFELKRVYANGQVTGQDGEFHQDDTEDGSMTFLYYMNTVNGGETEFRCDDHVVVQKPIVNLGIIFDAKMFHRGLGPSDGDDTRVTIAWKLKEIPKFNFFTEPVPFCIIHDYYTPVELELMWKELDFLQGKFLEPEKTGAAMGADGKPRKQNRGLFLDDVYTRRELSNILQLNRKIGSAEILNPLFQTGQWFYRYLSPSPRLGDRTLISYYEDGDHYKPHTDAGVITAISYHWREPATFTGGDLYFGNFRVPIQNNCLLIFPSCTEHEVKPVSGQGRYALTQFLNFH